MTLFGVDMHLEILTLELLKKYNCNYTYNI